MTSSDSLWSGQDAGAEPPSPKRDRRLTLESLEKDLNPEQLAAVMHGEGPLLIVAGAGSGKTRVITYRMARLISDGLSPSRILALTFTNKAAAEMRERTRALAGYDGADAWISTFHSACLRILRRDAEKLNYPKDFAVYDSQDQDRLIKLCMAELGIDDKQTPPRQMGAMISGFKSKIKGPRDAEMEMNSRHHADFLRLFALYDKKLGESRCMDFDDLLVKTVFLLRNHPDVRERYMTRFLHILVDEFQDTNMVQYEMVRLLVSEPRNVCVVGDDDQSIYRWRGADIGNILNFEKDFPNTKVVTLERNYRSTSNILSAANAVVSRNTGRREKKLWTENATGEKIRVHTAVDEMDEGRFVAKTVLDMVRRDGRGLNHFAVFYRTNSQSRPIEDALRRDGIGYKIYGGLKFYERKEVKDILAYFKAALNPLDMVALKRVVNTPPRGIGQVTIERVEAFAVAEGKTLMAALEGIELFNGFPHQAAAKFASFRDILAKVRELALTRPAADAIAEALTVTGYMDWISKDNDAEAMSRMENLNELVNAAGDFSDRAEDGSLQAFLDQASLVADADSVDEGAGAVKLMTVHVSKGLEFPVVFVTGLEEEIFPHARSKDDPMGLEEERRLMYVAMTRARERLFLTHAQTRRVFGSPQANRPSRFLKDMPDESSSWEGGAPKILFDGARPAFSKTAGAGGGGWENRQPVRSIPVPPKAPAPQRVGFIKAPIAAVPVSPSEDGEFSAGMKVRHPSFHVGIIRSVEGKGDNSKITVYFPRFGEKKLVMKFAKLTAV
jgi:DNA helicase-2/ATP-dependent DNA helicase PcrA